MGDSPRTALEIRLLGPVQVRRGGEEVSLPRSRKVRALLAFLALEGAPTSRSRLCDLLWDVPNDPRGELRWCLSKLRAVLDDGDDKRVVTTAQSLIGLDLSGAKVDALEIARITKAGVAAATTADLAAAAELFRGDLLDGMVVDGPELTAWLTAQRQRHRAAHVAILAELTARREADAGDPLRWIEAWIRATPFDRRPHEAMIAALVAAGRVRDAEAHVNATIRAFEQEGAEWSSIREAFHAARRAGDASIARESVVLVKTPPAAALSDRARAEARPKRHGSVVVMPFADDGAGPSQVANGLTDDIITRLAKLRVLFVIARGTAYALRERGVDALEAGRILDVAYVVSGTVRRRGERMSVLVELVETEGGGIVWTDEIDGRVDDTFSVLDSIVDRIVAAVSEEIERAETKRTLLKPPSSLDAWEAYHRGLWHMYRFTGPDNELGARFFQDALALDPSFARAYAGLSFTHFQNVFLDLTPDRDRQMALAIETAGQSLASDDRDPASHWAMGRALWLRGEQGEAIAELERSVELSPNFALGHYTLGFVHAQSGDPDAAIDAADYSRELSPFDPLQFGMLGSRALAHMRLGERDAAAEWAVKAASRPNAHSHILAIAALNLALAERTTEAREMASKIRARQPDYRVEHLLRVFRFTPDGERLLREGARRIGLD